MKAEKFLLQSLLICLLAACGTNAPALSTTTPAPIIAPTAAPTSPSTAAKIITAGPIATSQPTESPVELVWKISGDPNPFSSPSGLALDQQGNLYVVDAGNSRVQEFDSQGHFITKWGSHGSGDGQFVFLEHIVGGVAVDGQGKIYVTDGGNSRVQIFDGHGQFLAAWGIRGHGDGQFSSPLGVAVDRQGNVYVGDNDAARIQKLDGNGKFLTKWGTFGKGNGQFNEPAIALAIDAQGNVYVPDFARSDIQKFDRQGQFLAKWDTCGSGPFSNMVTAAVALDAQGNIYVTDYGNNRVCKFDANGHFMTRWGDSGSGDGQFAGPSGIVVDGQGNVYVADARNNRIQKFRQR